MPASEHVWSVVVIGGANADIVASADPLSPGVSTPGQIRIGTGGTGRNVAENLSRLGVRVRLIGAVGTDPLSDFVLACTERAGVDISGITRMPNCTNVYVAVISSGLVASAVSDMSAAESLTPEHIAAQAEVIRAADFVVVDANLAPETIAQAVRLAAGRALCLLPVSAAKASRMAPHLGAASLIVLGAAELQTLTRTVIHAPADAIEAVRGLPRAPESGVVVTMGARGLV